jgi:glutathione S-transferase
MLILYIRTGCHYCAKVLAAGEEMHIEFEIKNVSDSALAAELISLGGKLQLPYLVDHENNKEMYESDDIIAYLHQNFGNNT